MTVSEKSRGGGHKNVEFHILRDLKNVGRCRTLYKSALLRGTLFSKGDTYPHVALQHESGYLRDIELAAAVIVVLVEQVCNLFMSRVAKQIWGQ